MAKRLLKWALVGAFSVLLMGAAVSCKDYSSDIENLQSQITSLSGSVDYLQSLINQGKVVTSVAQTADGTGVTISFSDGSSYTIYNGKDGADGNDGQDADVWTIGNDGYWYKNGEKQNYKAIGTDGDTPFIDSEGYWCMGYDDDGNPVRLKDANGDPILARGANGDTITVTTTTDGYKITITHSDGTSESYEITNGTSGTPGTPGDDGKSYVLIPCEGGDDCPNHGEALDGWFNLYEVTEGDDGELGYKLSQAHYYQYAVIDDGATETPEDPEEGEDEDTTYASLIVMWDGNYLYIYNLYTPQYDDDGNILKDDEGNTLYEIAKNPYEIFLGNELNSVAFVPSFIDTETGYPTTAPFVNISTYFDETLNYDADGDDYAEGDFIPQSGNLYSGTVNLVYRLNPSNAYVEGSDYDFITRTVQTRGTESSVGGDKESLFTIILDDEGNKATHNGETITFAVQLTGTVSADDVDLAALRVCTGSNPEGVVTSDYIRVKASGESEVTPVLVAVNPESSEIATVSDDETGDNSSDGTESALTPGFYPRTKGLGTATGENKYGYATYTTETSDFIHQFIDKAKNTDPDADGYEETTNTDFSSYVLDNCEFAYGSSDYITGRVELYVEVDGESTKLSDIIGESAITYEYVIPDHFYIDGVDQQEHVQVIVYDEETADESKGHLVGAYIDVDGDSPLTYGHYPVVRVDAKVSGYLVASTYIVYHITGTEQKPYEIDLNEVLNDGEAYYVHYRGIQTNYNSTGATALDEICGMTLEEFYDQLKGVNTKIEDDDELLEYYLTNYYVEDEATLTAYICAHQDEDTWTYDKYEYSSRSWTSGEYSTGEEEDPEITTTSYDDLTKLKDWWDEISEEYDFLSGYKQYLTQAWYQQHDGFVVKLNIPAFAWDGNVVSLGVDDSIHTQHKYNGAKNVAFPAEYDKDENLVYEAKTYDEAAEYICRFTITSKDTKVAPDITVTVHIYCVDDCESLELNELYRLPDPQTYDLPEGTDAVLVKGTTENGTFENTTDVKEHFAGTGNIFEYGDEDQNVKGIEFSWNENTEGVTPDEITSDNSVVGLSDPIEDAYVAKLMDYNEILDNGEYCPSSYYIVFVNPFKKGDDGSVSLDDSTEATTADVKEPITVYDLSGNLILSYGETTTESEDEDDDSETTYGWILGDAAATYGLTSTESISVTYSLDEEADDWAYLQKNLQGGQALSFDETTGIVTWSNGGTTLVYSYSFDVEVTVTVGTIAKFTFTTTVELNPNSSYGPRPTSLSTLGANVVL